MRTVIESIRNHGAWGGAVTFPSQRERLTWRELHLRALRMATVLRVQGVSRGSVVTLPGETALNVVAAIQAVWLCGAAISISPPAGDVVDVTELAEQAESASPAQPSNPDPADLAVLQYTSGSTRIPQGVAITHGNLAANLTAMRAASGHATWHPGPLLSWLPLYHDMGLVGFLALPMSCGCDLFLLAPATFAANPAGWLSAVAEHRIAVTGGPNFAYAIMARLMRAGFSADLSSLRRLITGAEPIDAAMMREFVSLASAHGLNPQAISPAYGLAEATLAVTMASGLHTDWVDAVALEKERVARPAAGGAGAREFVKTGKPVPGMEIRITGGPAGERGIGHIEVSGPSVSGAGWLRTGDLGYWADGELVVCGRVKDVLFAAGRNIFPQDVEATACAVPGVRPNGAAAFAVPGELGDRIVVAVETRGQNRAAITSGVASAVLAGIGVSPAAVVPVPPGHLPRTSSGKVRRAETRRRYLEGALH